MRLRKKYGDLNEINKNVKGMYRSLTCPIKIINLLSLNVNLSSVV